MFAFERLFYIPLLPAALISALAVRLMASAGVLDRPDARKAHGRPVPKGGGVGPVAAVAATVLFAGAVGDGTFNPLALVAAAGLAAVALADDVRDFRFTVKLAAQVLAAGLAVAGGTALRSVRVPPFGTVELGWLGSVVTVCWIVFVTNALNFIDGLNGLAAGASLLAALVLGLCIPDAGPAVVGLALAAGLAGFLPFNYPRARIFMGDVGSQFCGYLLAVLSVAAAQEGLAAFTGPLLLFGILFDVAWTLCRRAIGRQRVWQAHRGHLYQVAQRSGMPAAAVAAVHWGFVLWGAWCAVLMDGGSHWALPLVVLPQAAWVMVVGVLARRAGTGPW